VVEPVARRPAEHLEEHPAEHLEAGVLDLELHLERQQALPLVLDAELERVADLALERVADLARAPDAGLQQR